MNTSLLLGDLHLDMRVARRRPGSPVLGLDAAVGDIQMYGFASQRIIAVPAGRQEDER
jgi:hypothetical protein